MAKLGRNDACPCRSGKKVKSCCGVDARRKYPLTPDMLAAIEVQKEKFREQFGREMGPDDKIFFDAPPVEHIEAQTVAAMKEANWRPELIHAYERTGRIVTEENMQHLTEEELDEWNDAVNEYLELHSDD